MINKQFENKSNGERVVVKNNDGVWVTLNNGAKIKNDTFLNKYTEVLDPNSFFNNAGNMNELANKIKNVDPSKVNYNNSSPEPVVKKSNESFNNDMANNIDKKQELINNYLREQKQKSQDLSKYRQIDDDELAAEQLIKGSNEQNNTPNEGQNDVQQQDYQPQQDNVQQQDYQSQQDNVQQQNYQYPPSQQKQKSQEELAEEESYKFFRGFKKNHKIKIVLEFDEMIAEPEFLKLMMNNFEADIVKYYTKEIYNKIINDTKKVEDDIYEQLEKIINGKKKTTRRRKTTSRSKATTTTTTKKNVSKEGHKPKDELDVNDSPKQENKKNKTSEKKSTSSKKNEKIDTKKEDEKKEKVNNEKN